MAKRRVVITGLGAISPLGETLDETWQSLLEGKSGAGPVSRFDTSEHTTKFACEVSGYDPRSRFTKLELRRFDLFAQYMMIAGDEAMADAGIQHDAAKDATGEPLADPTRAGCILGTGIGGIFEFEDTVRTALSRGVSRVSPFFIPKMICNAMTGFAAIRYGLQGTAYSTVSACASSSHAIGMALRSIQYGDADIVLTGGSEGATSILGLGGFCAMKALSTRNDNPQGASRPFDRDRDGFVMGEGAAALILEEYEHAKARGADIYAEVLGFGSTDDAHHITAPREDADGSSRAIAAALRDGGVEPDQVDYVNAHGTSTELNDKTETLALKKVLGDRAYKVPVSSTKSMIGHLLGASGAIELAASALSIRHGVVHPTINYETPDPNCDLDYVPNEARDHAVNVAISNSLGFGGHNTCLAIGRI